MLPLDSLLALTLLGAPGPDRLPVPAALLTPLAPALVRLAIAREVLDPREACCYLVRPECLVNDLAILRRRARELVDTPPASDALRFPNHALLQEMLAGNRRYHEHLHVQLSLYPSRAAALGAALAETDACRQRYDRAADASAAYLHVGARRLALARLRELLGGRDYYAGVLGPQVPAGRLARIGD